MKLAFTIHWWGGYPADVPHSVENIHRICDTCMMPVEVKNPWIDKETKNG